MNLTIPGRMKFSCLRIVLLVALWGAVSCSQQEVVIVTSEKVPERVMFGVEKLSRALAGLGYKTQITTWLPESKKKIIFVGIKNEKIAGIESLLGRCDLVKTGKESFRILSSGNSIIIYGADASGSLYGCLELAGRIKKAGKLPQKIDFSDQPEMVLRGACIGLQKTQYLPGRDVYEYPYTPDNFPWFYDKGLWIEYLDMLAENRMNSLYLWNGHPFASLVKIDDYPYAVEVDEETFRLNEEMFSFLTKEADKRGIWVIQMFYNIIVSKPFAEKNGLKTQDRERPIIPLISDYTRKSIAAFIEKYPNVGLLVCLGEAINSVDDDVEWFTKTIIPGVQDGLKALGRTDEPPVVLRAHDTDAEKVMAAALPLYKNLYTMAKYNGESLTTYEPRDSWATLHQNLSRLGPVHISNVHILANLEPFRYGSPDFIQRCVQAMHDIQGANGLHLYPQASYWDWPYSADNTTPRLLQTDRDWIWYKAWGRYAWNCRRDSLHDAEYWIDEIGNFYGCGKKGENILEAYEQTGQIAPKLLRRFGISDGNRQTLLLGMFMSQLVNPGKWQVYSNFYSSNGPQGETLAEYAGKEWFSGPHSGELPPQIIDEVVTHGKLAVGAIENATSSVRKNKEEFGRLKNDVYCYNSFANFFSEKVKAALWVLKYKYSGDIADLEKAIPFLEKSLEYYAELVSLTKDTYLYANSMQTRQRRIPVSGDSGRNKTWAELLPQYQTELDNFKRNIETLKSGGGQAINNKLEPVEVTMLTKGTAWVPLKKGGTFYNDSEVKIIDVAEELQNLKGLRLNDKKQQNEGTILRFENKKPVQVLVGYFNTNSYTVLQPPTLETNASANDRGQADIKIANALKLDGLYPVNIYTYRYESGTNELVLGKGRVLILGFIDGNTEIRAHDAGLSGSDDGVPVDWLFY